MKRFRACSGCILAASVGLTGCFHTTRTVLRTQPPDSYRTANVQELEKGVSDRDDHLKTLSASVMITASTGGGKEGEVKTYTSFQGFIFLQQPSNLRVLLKLPVVGSRALDMVSDGKTFTLLIPPRNKAITGTDEVTTQSKNGLENLRPHVFLDSLLVQGIDKQDYVTLTESTRVLQPAPRAKFAIEEPDYDLTVLAVKQEQVLTPKRVIHISRVNMLPYQQDIYDEHGRVVTQAVYEKYQDYGGTQFPARITIRRPLDEYQLVIDVTKLTLNDVLPDDQFQIQIPPGLTVQKMN